MASTETNQNQTQAKPVEKFSLPKNYDVVTEYQENTEQGIVDSLFDYFGRVYYQSDVNSKGGNAKAKNQYISKYDSQILKMFTRRTNALWFAFAILFLIGVGGLLAILLGVGYTAAAFNDFARQNNLF